MGEAAVLRQKSDNEVGGLGISEPEDTFVCKRIPTVKQEVTGVSVRFDDSAVADFFDAQVDLDLTPENCTIAD